MAQGLRASFSRFALACLLLGGSCSWAENPSASPSEEEKPVSAAEVLPAEAKEKESLLQFFKERTKLGYGYNLTYDDNLFLQDNNKQEEFTSVLEGQIFFVDSRGALDYGATYEANGYRYHRKDANAIDHDLLAFVTFEPGTPYRLGLNYKLDVSNRFVLTEEEGDLFRRSSDFQRQVEHHGAADLFYSFGSVDALVSEISLTATDDQTLQDANTDRRKLESFIAWQREIRPRWHMALGYEFEDLDIPGNKNKSSVAHLGRWGLIYEATEEAKVEGILRWGERSFHDGDSDRVTGVELISDYPIPITPRLLAKLNYSDRQTSSFDPQKKNVRIKTGQAELNYELTPLTLLKAGATYTKNRSTGSGTPTTFSRLYITRAGWTWQLRPKASLSLTYRYHRSKSRDYVDRQILMEFEGEL